MRKIPVQETSLGGAAGEFPQTQWDVICRARDAAPEVRRAGLEELCRGYWKPVYRYFRRGGAVSNEDAKDLTQAFFLWITEKETLNRYSADRASFRTFLKALLKHFAEHRDRALRRLKRGGGVKVLRLDGESSPLMEVVSDARAVDPEQEFERSWLNEVAVRAVERLRRRLALEGQAIQFRTFEEYDLSGDSEISYKAVADRLGLKVSDVRNYLFGVREQLRLEVQAELARTTKDPEAFEEEWNALFGS